jgi:hypothetical protein
METLDLEALSRTLEEAVEQVPEAAREAVTVAANALHYLYVTGQFTAFQEYLRDADGSVSSSVDPAHVFATMQQAEEWLRQQPPSSWGMLAKVAGKTFVVGKRAEMRLVLLPSFEPQDVE